MDKKQIRDILLEGMETKKPDNTEEYADIQKKLNNTMLKQSKVMKAAGLGDPDNATDRSLFSKKLKKAKNSDGGVYQFNQEEIAAILRVINNPTGYIK